MRLLLDSKLFIAYCSGDPQVVDRLDSAVQIWVPFVVLAEIRLGARLLKRGDVQAQLLTRFLQQPGVFSAHSTDATTHHYSILYTQLRRQGTPIPVHDIWIAALALEHSLILYTHDAHFTHLPKIPTVR